MKRSPAWIMAFASVATWMVAAAPAEAQWGPSPYYHGGGYPAQQAYYMPPPYMPPPGAPPMMGPGAAEGMLAGYNAPLVVHDPHVAPAGLLRCTGCGGGGCNACGGGAAMGLFQRGAHSGETLTMGDSYLAPGLGLGMGTPGGVGCNDGQGILGKHGPMGTCGCCTPRWWDFQAEALYYEREDVSRTVDFATLGVGGPVVLSTTDLDFDAEPGFRLQGAILLGPGTNLEGGYFGMFNWTTQASVTSTANNLFSAYSQFGAIAPPNLPEANNSDLQSIAYSTELHNWELNIRRRWVSPNCRFHSSWLVGARYLALDEDLLYTIRSGAVTAETTDTLVSTRNELVGFQTGGDLLVCIVPRLKAGLNLKATLGGVRAENRTTVDLQRPVNPAANQIFRELAGEEDLAFVGEGGFEVIFEATERTTLRAGYQLLFVDGVALAPENFNPDFRLGVRDPVVNDNGDVFYHGFQGGFEFTW